MLKFSLSVYYQIAVLTLSINYDTRHQIITNAKIFLKCILSNCSINSFDQLRHETYCDKKFNFNLEKFSPTSESIRQHIKRAHLQCYLWFHSSFSADDKLNPFEYGNWKHLSILCWRWQLIFDSSDYQWKPHSWRFSTSQ